MSGLERSSGVDFELVSASGKPPRGDVELSPRGEGEFLSDGSTSRYMLTPPTSSPSVSSFLAFLNGELECVVV